MRALHATLRVVAWDSTEENAGQARMQHARNAPQSLSIRATSRQGSHGTRTIARGLVTTGTS